MKDETIPWGHESLERHPPNMHLNAHLNRIPGPQNQRRNFLDTRAEPGPAQPILTNVEAVGQQEEWTGYGPAHRRWLYTNPHPMPEAQRPHPFLPTDRPEPLVSTLHRQTPALMRYGRRWRWPGARLGAAFTC